MNAARVVEPHSAQTHFLTWPIKGVHAMKLSGNSIFIHFQKPLMTKWRELLDVKSQDSRVPPHDRCAPQRRMQTGPNRPSGRGRCS